MATATATEQPTLSAVTAQQDIPLASDNEPIFADPAETQPDVSLLATTSSINVIEGSTYTLTVSGVSGTVTWTSSNTAAATVNSAGVVTGVKAGISTITAKKADGSTASCVVYVTVATGMYRISYAGMMLGTTGGVQENTPACLATRADTGLAQLQQL